ncbi:MAG: IPT/TIG domain-containing protein [Myxococcota bacterium]
MILALLGCGFGLDPLAEDGGGTISIVEVSPRWGPPDGGTEVTITGTGFVGEVAVTFGNADVIVTVVDAQTIVATTPYAGVEATVDVSVTSDLGRADAPGAFAYSEDEPEETDADTDADADADADDDGTGAVVETSVFVVACPECFGVTQQVYVSASAAFHDGVRGSWTEWLPAVGDCANGSLTPAGPADAFVDVGDWVDLRSRSQSISMQGTPGADGVTYLADDLTEADWESGADFDLSVPEGGEWGAFEVENAVETPENFTDVQPVELLEPNPQRAFSARIRKTGQEFTWAPYGGDGSILLLVDVYSAQGSYQGTVSCREADDGRLTLPSSALNAYQANSLLAVSIYRYQLATFDLPTGAEGESVSSIGYMGTGVLVQ